jgi:hypothetical protein
MRAASNLLTRAKNTVGNQIRGFQNSRAIRQANRSMQKVLNNQNLLDTFKTTGQAEVKRFLRPSVMVKRLNDGIAIDTARGLRGHAGTRRVWLGDKSEAQHLVQFTKDGHNFDKWATFNQGETGVNHGKAMVTNFARKGTQKGTTLGTTTPWRANNLEESLFNNGDKLTTSHRSHLQTQPPAQNVVNNSDDDL